MTIKLQGKARAEALAKIDGWVEVEGRDAIAKTKLTASTGEISFNALGEVRKNVQVQMVKGGAWRRHSVISDPDLLAPPSK